ncbi:MAG: cyclic pyranopterin monophosphate synthase MoaC [bacterium]
MLDDTGNNSSSPDLLFSHLDEHGRASMVDVGQKPLTLRVARASGLVRMQPETLNVLTMGQNPKGEVLSVARIAGIQAAKATDRLIPLCHSLGLDSVEVHFEARPPDAIAISAEARVTGKTGVEMEAMVAVSVSALTIYDMCKAIDRSMLIESVGLEYKSGGRSGEFRRN